MTGGQESDSHKVQNFQDMYQIVSSEPNLQVLRRSDYKILENLQNYSIFPDDQLVNKDGDCIPHQGFNFVQLTKNC